MSIYIYIAIYIVCAFASFGLYSRYINKGEPSLNEVFCTFLAWPLGLAIALAATIAIVVFIPVNWVLVRFATLCRKGV